MSKPKLPPMNTLRFIFIAVVLMLLADTYLFGGKRSYIEEAKREYHEAHPEEVVAKEPPRPVRVEPGMGRDYFEAPMQVEKMEEAIASPNGKVEESKDVPLVITEKPAPLPDVVEPGPFKGSAKIAIIIDDLGMDLKRSRAALDLPAPITMAFLPYGTKTKDYAVVAKEKGHPLIIHAPMEAVDGKLNIGPGGLRADMDDATFKKNFDVMLQSFDGYVGINNHMGSRLTQDSKAMKRLMAILKERGLFFVDSKTINHSVAAEEARAAGVPYAERDVFLDHVESREFVDHALAQLEQRALKEGSAIAIGHPKDATIAGLKAWIPTLKAKGIELVPVSELLVRPKVATQPSPAIMGAAPASGETLPAPPAPQPQLPAIY